MFESAIIHNAVIKHIDLFNKSIFVNMAEKQYTRAIYIILLIFQQHIYINAALRLNLSSRIFH